MMGFFVYNSDNNKKFIGNLIRRFLELPYSAKKPFLRYLSLPPS